MTVYVRIVTDDATYYGEDTELTEDLTDEKLADFMFDAFEPVRGAIQIKQLNGNWIILPANRVRSIEVVNN